MTSAAAVYYVKIQTGLTVLSSQQQYDHQGRDDFFHGRELGLKKIHIFPNREAATVGKSGPHSILPAYFS